MNDRLWPYVLGFVLLIVATILVLWVTSAAASETFCADDLGEPGLLVVDQCWTAAQYDQAFAPQALAAIESLSLPGRSVAEVYGLGSESPPRVPASERPRVFMGVSEPSFAELLARAADAFDNPALEGL